MLREVCSFPLDYFSISSHPRPLVDQGLQGLRPLVANGTCTCCVIRVTFYPVQTSPRHHFQLSHTFSGLSIFGLSRIQDGFDRCQGTWPGGNELRGSRHSSLPFQVWRSRFFLHVHQTVPYKLYFPHPLETILRLRYFGRFRWKSQNLWNRGKSSGLSSFEPQYRDLLFKTSFVLFESFRRILLFPSSHSLASPWFSSRRFANQGIQGLISHLCDAFWHHRSMGESSSSFIPFFICVLFR